ncbi:DUF2785 domain-containing protein [Streptomyces sp. enrichment culture]|uniref:DUF2785 domain-containing protein n=1 Tax=Streptomyces sp. enrichment culture TaxID=1795815 RepID=UPI003F54C616
MPSSLRYDGDIRALTGAPRAAALLTLVEDLRAQDPRIRDDGAYAAAARWIPVLTDDERGELGERVTGHFGHPEVQARSFAPLVLARIAETGGWREEWWRPFADWYPAERDLRGHDAELGWLHAAAHGADLLAALARQPGQDPARLADLAVARLLAPTEHVFDAQEDDRLAYALAQVLSHPGLDAETSTAWLGPVERAFRTGAPGPVPAWASNTMRTLRMLYLLADRGVRTRHTDEPPRTLTHREAVLEGLAGTLAVVAPYAG